MTENSKIVGQFEKNPFEVVKVQLQTWKSQCYVDIRVWTLPRPGDGEAQPTHKGITMSIELLPELKKAIDSALAEVEIEDEIAEDVQNG